MTVRGGLVTVRGLLVSDGRTSDSDTVGSSRNRNNYRALYRCTCTNFNGLIYLNTLFI